MREDGAPEPRIHSMSSPALTGPFDAQVVDERRFLRKAVQPDEESRAGFRFDNPQPAAMASGGSNANVGAVLD
jgi:hypothetical protein